ncbi:MAG: hypothetical protein ACREKS_01365 [Candidatus Rokuibacteriota bacterium]
MIDRNWSAGRSILVGVVALAMLGCASSGWPKFIGHDDVKSVAGAWQGGLIGQTGGLLAMGLTVNTDGSYVTTAEAYSSQGTASVRDGTLVFQPAGTAGGSAPERTAVATLSQRDDGRLVLTGSGRSEAGPFSFVVTKM